MSLSIFAGQARGGEAQADLPAEAGAGPGPQPKRQDGASPQEGLRQTMYKGER